MFILAHIGRKFAIVSINDCEIQPMNWVVCFHSIFANRCIIMEKKNKRNKIDGATTQRNVTIDKRTHV